MPRTCAATASGPRAATKWMRWGSGSPPFSRSSSRRRTSGMRPSVSGSGRGRFGHSAGGSSRCRIDGGESDRQTTRAPKPLGSFAMPYSTQKPGRKTTSGKRAMTFRYVSSHRRVSRKKSRVCIPAKPGIHGLSTMSATGTRSGVPPRAAVMKSCQCRGRVTLHLAGESGGASLRHRCFEDEGAATTIAPARRAEPRRRQEPRCAPPGWLRARTEHRLRARGEHVDGVDGRASRERVSGASSPW